jgi:hypothetical protein
MNERTGKNEMYIPFENTGEALNILKYVWWNFRVKDSLPDETELSYNEKVNGNDFKEYAMIKGKLEVQETKQVQPPYDSFFRISGKPKNYNLLEQMKSIINRKTAEYEVQTAKMI